MPERYHIEPKPVAPLHPRIGKYGVVDWREDCAGCHNCVKKTCVFDRYRQETQYIRGLNDVNALFFECMGCFSCVQQCTKGLLSLSINPAFEKLGNEYWTPDIILSTWTQAENAKVPVSGAGYRGKFSGPGFDSMWTDMSEIVRPTRDGIHGREYISTAVDIGRKPSLLVFDENRLMTEYSPVIDIPMPLIIDMMYADYFIPELIPIFKLVAAKTGLLVIINYKDYDLLGTDKEKYLPHIAFYLNSETQLPSVEVLQQTKLVEISDGKDIEHRIKALKKMNPDIVVAVRIDLNSKGEQRAIELGHQPFIEVLHLVADMNGNELDSNHPKFVKDMVRHVHTTLVKEGVRDEITIIASGGIALAEHLAKQIICGADLISINLPLLIALECRLCKKCAPGPACPVRIREIDMNYGAGRMINLLAAWHDQLIEVMGAMGIREARRLRGETGRALFFDDLEEETFGRLFGSRNRD